MIDGPKTTENYHQFFCANEESQEKRTRFYRLTESLVRAYAEIARMHSVGYDSTKEREIREEIKHYEKVYQEIQISSGIILI